MSIVAKIDSLIHAKRLNKTALARELNINRDTLYNWNDENFKVSTLVKIAGILGVPLSDFFDEKTFYAGEIKKVSYKSEIVENFLVDNKTGLITIFFK
jgi:DNA-binding Xre family transcriptional regulator